MSGQVWVNDTPHPTVVLVDPKTGEAGTTRVLASNFTKKIRDQFQTFVEGERWVFGQRQAGDIVQIDGNAVGASYLVISKDPWTTGVTSIESVEQGFTMPVELAFGMHRSNATVGQEFAAEFVSTTRLPEIPDLPILNISQSGTVLTINFAAPHNLRPGQAIGIRDCADSRANYPLAVIGATPTETQIVVSGGPLPSVSIATQTSGFVYIRSRLGYAEDGTSMILENSAGSQASFYVRGAGGDVLPTGSFLTNHIMNVGNSISAQPVNTVGAYAFQPSTVTRLLARADRIQWMDAGSDSTSGLVSRMTRDQVCPAPDANYKLRFRATNNASLSRPIAKIVQVVKSGTTTATVTTDRPHGLQANLSYINAFGVANSSAFPNISSSVVVTAVIDATTFQVVWGTASTSTSYGGIVSIVNGNQVQQGVAAQTATSVTISADGRLQVTGSANWSGLLIGDYVNLEGCYNSATGALIGVDGTYRVNNVVTNALTLEVIGTTVLPGSLGATACGGAVLKRTDLRLSFVRVFDYERERVEMAPAAMSDITNSSNVTVVNTPSVGQSGTWALGVYAPTVVTDVTSGAITSTTTTSAVTPAFGCSYEVNVPVTAVSGTGPTMDVSVEESDDGGINWFKVYDFPRITAVGMYRSPKLPLTGNRVRYVQTIGGTSPSFTRVINRLQCNEMADEVRQLIDRTVALTTLGGTTPSLNIQNCRNVQLIVNIGAATTAPALVLEGSDDNGATWYQIGTPLTAVASSTVQTTVAFFQSQLVRARVSTAGAGVTMGHVTVKGF